MSTRRLSRSLLAALLVAVMLVGALAAPRFGAAADQGGGGTKILTCDSQSSGVANPPTGGAPSTGPATANSSSSGASQQNSLALWCASQRSGGLSPDIPTPSSCALTGSSTLAPLFMMFSGRGLDWVC